MLRPRLEALEERCVLSAIDALLPAAIDLGPDPSLSTSGQITQPGGQELYRVTLSADGLLTADLRPTGFASTLTLLDDQGNVLIQGQAAAAFASDAHVTQHLPAGTYFLDAAGQSGSGAFALSTSFTATAAAPYQPINEGSGAYVVTAADLTGNGISDLIVADYNNNQLLINRGLGDGTFQSATAVPVGAGPVEVVAGDFTGNGIVDLAVADNLSNTITILLGNGDGTFRPGETIPTDAGPTGLVLGDFTGNGRLDLAVTNQVADTVQVFLGNGDGTFTPSFRVGVAGAPTGIVAGDFLGDGHLDLAVASESAGAVFLLAGTGTGMFFEQQRLGVGPGCATVVAGDFNGDGRPDLAAVDPTKNTVAVFLNDGDGVFAPAASLATGTEPLYLVAADFNGDGHDDLVVTNFGSNNVSLFLGNGDGTFQPGATLATGHAPVGLVAADLHGPGRPDLVVSNFNSLSLSVLLNNGDGTFNTPPPVPADTGTTAVLAADLTGSGRTDLIAVNTGANDLSVLLGRGDGTFRTPILVPTGASPYGAVVGDFNGDHIPDLAVVNYASSSIWIYQGDGDGTFHHTETLATGNGPDAIQAADLTGDGDLDLVVANFLDNDIEIFYGHGDGTFSSPVVIPVGMGPTAIAIANFNGSGRPDIAVSDFLSNDVALLRNAGDGTFEAPVSIPVGASPWLLTTADLRGNGRADLIVANYSASGQSAVSVLYNNGDGSFQTPISLSVGGMPAALAVGDFNDDGVPDILVDSAGPGGLSLLAGQAGGGFSSPVPVLGTGLFDGMAVGHFGSDGDLDIAAADIEANTLTVALGQGDGTFASPSTVSLTPSGVPMVAADFTDDGQVDMAVADPIAGTLTIRMAQGDGTFVDETPIVVGGEPSALVAGDFNGDGRIDLAVTDAQNGTVLVLMGLGNGTFQPPVRYQVGGSPDAIVAGDFGGDGHVDLAVADSRSNDVTILYGAGNGVFRLGPKLPVGTEPVSLVAADLEGNGRLDLVTANRTSGNVTIIWNNGNGTFEPTTWTTPGLAPVALVAADFADDGRVDLAVADQANDRVLILWGQPGRTFSAPQVLSLSHQPVALAASNLDADGSGIDLVVASEGAQHLTAFFGLTPGSYQRRITIPITETPAGLLVDSFTSNVIPDIAVADAATGGVDMLVGAGNGVFSSPESAVPLPLAPPLVVTNPVQPDALGAVMTVDQNGQVLLRYASPGTPGDFAPPIVTTAVGTGYGVTSSNEYAVSQVQAVVSPHGTMYASLERDAPLLILTLPLPDGAVQDSFVPLPAGGVYTRLVAGDLEHDGLDDILILDHATNQILTYRQDASGQFHEDPTPLQAGAGATDLVLADLSHDGWLDLLVTDGASGDLTVFDGGPGSQFGAPVELAAGINPASTIVTPDGGLERSSPDQPIGVATGVFNPATGLTGAAVLLHGSDQLSILQGTPGGGLASPSLANTYATGLDPIQVIAAPLGRNGLIDLIVLNAGSHDISIYMNNGHGGFTVMPRVDAGNDPTGIALSDVNGDRTPDLLVGNGDGDLLTLIGNGDGSFQPYQRADPVVTLAFGNLTGGGAPDVVLSNASQDLLSVQSLQSSYRFLQGRDNGLLAPGPVAIADLTGNGIPDLIVANSGGNDVLVYLGLGGGQFAPPLAFYTGTDPIGLAVADLTGNGVPDLVVTNAGSNDVTVLLGVGRGSAWTMVPGPRLRVGARPVSVTVAKVPGDPYPDLFVVNQDSDSVTWLRGLGGGFFDDQHALTIAAGVAPIQAFVGKFTGTSGPGLVVLNSMSNDMTFYPDILQTTSAALTIPTGGVDPIAGAMGDFMHNGFDSLVVADSTDSRIALFDGTANGLVLANSITLADSVHPTDLVISGSSAGSLQLFVSAVGQGQAIPVSVSLLNPSTSTAQPTANEGAALLGSAGWASSPAASTALIGLAAFFNNEIALGNGGQTPAAWAPAAEAAVAAPAAATVVASAPSPAGQPLFNASVRSLAWLVDNLVSSGDAQTSDLLPLGNSGMASVAILLSVSSTLDRSPAETEGPLARLAEDTVISPVAVVRPDESESDDAPPHSPVAQFLCLPRGHSAAWTSELERPVIASLGADCEWVWRQASLRAPVPGSDTRVTVDMGTPGPPAAVSRALTDSDTGANTAAAIQGGAEEYVPANHPGIAVLAASVLALAAALARRWSGSAHSVGRTHPRPSWFGSRPHALGRDANARARHRLGRPDQRPRV